MKEFDQYGKDTMEMKCKAFVISCLLAAGIPMCGCNKEETPAVNEIDVTVTPSQLTPTKELPTQLPSNDSPTVTEITKPHPTLSPVASSEDAVTVTSTNEVMSPTESIKATPIVEEIYGEEEDTQDEENIFADGTKAYLSDKNTVAKILILDDEITITGIAQTHDQTVCVPATIDGKKVVAIASESFSNVNVTEVELEEGIRTIESQAFYANENLIRIAIPKSVEEIGSNAFGNCTNLTMIDLDSRSSHFSVSNGVLYNKTMTKLIRFPSGRKDESYVVSDGTISIEDGAFSMSQHLNYISFPSSIRSIGNEAFAGCVNLDFDLPSRLVEVNTFAFADCHSLKKVIIPDGLDEIPEGAFSGCEQLRNIVFQGNIKEIGYAAFSNCTSLTTIEVKKTIENIGVMAFAFCTDLKKVELPEGVQEIADMAFYGCSQLHQIAIPKTVTYFGGKIFEKTSNIVILAPIRSDAYHYAKNNGIIYQES